MADKTRKIQIRLTEEELVVLKFLSKYEAEGMTDWICQALKRRQKEMHRKAGWTVDLMRRQI